MRRKKEKAPPQREFCAAVIAAGGQAVRMEGLGKILLDLDGIPLIAHTLLAFEASPDIDEIVIAAAPEDILPLGQVCRDFGLTKVTKIVRGGENRVESVWNALMEVSPQAALCAVHDGARPLVTPDLIGRVVALGRRFGAAIPAVPLKDTVKFCEDGRVTGTADRAGMCAVQTPQVFDAALLKVALHQARDEGLTITDDASAVERMGMAVHLCDGSYENLKVTTPEDLELAVALLHRRKGL